ncbi:hypothetical protein Lal_00018097 [Lupinus albus]|nr:hypothetical protein Lal_00018097 [Lupinus albus]
MYCIEYYPYLYSQRYSFDSWKWRSDSFKIYTVKSASLKVITFSWRLFMDRIPTKIALSRRGITFSDGGGLLCPFCNDDLESAFHLFSSCKNPFHHYLNHLGLVNANKGWKAWSIIWFATVWAIWRHRNDIIFNKTSISIHHILDNAKVNAWLWIKNTIWVEFSLYSD